MSGKVILSLICLAFVSLQMANSLRCYQCNDVASCRNPIPVYCDQIHANATRNVSRAHYQNVRILNSTDFSCFVSAYNATNVTAMEVRGCIMTGTVDCISKLWNTSLTRDTCRVCQDDLCNVRNSSKGFTNFYNHPPQTPNYIPANTNYVPSNTNYIPQNTYNNNHNNISPHKNNTKPLKNAADTPISSVVAIIALLLLAKVFII